MTLKSIQLSALRRQTHPLSETSLDDAHGYFPMLSFSQSIVFALLSYRALNTSSTAKDVFGGCELVCRAGFVLLRVLRKCHVRNRALDRLLKQLLSTGRLFQYARLSIQFKHAISTNKND